MSQLAASKPPRRTRKSGLGTGLFLSLPVLSWALFDFANTIFSSNIVTIFFPLYLQQVLGGDARMDQIASTFISYANAASGLLLVVFTPLLGVWMDRTGRKKAFLVPFALAAILFTFLMGFTAYTDSPSSMFGLPLTIVMVLIFFTGAKFFYNSSQLFYDNMLPDIATGPQVPLVSGFGVAVGYVGTLMGLVVYAIVGSGDYPFAFILTAALFLIFSLPIMLLYKEKPAVPAPAASEGRRSFFSGYRDIYETFKEAKKHRAVFTFMVAYFFFNDAVATAIAMMSVYATAVMGFSAGQFILLYLVATVCAIIGSFIFGHITRRVGGKVSSGLVAIVLILALILAAAAFSNAVFWAAACLYGVAMGSLWVTSRTMIVELSPPDKRGQFFGLFAFSGKLSSVLGPLVYGTVTWALAGHGTLASRAALLSLVVMAVIGLAVLLRVPYKKPAEEPAA
ncbi:MFS transporter [Saccharibacillus alkalitolerans]|uniref:MFS transporter n=1 Tax=Saccharibacillus alkalitolerans TaxID=2705290 RepID=A0ABX0F581_9BACL|nr:MFS transporter [Saccharibacillus alkalitolerans]NGZ75124.1 MFS transporter [Saccharibacillus alkalitolerans]